MIDPRDIGRAAAAILALTTNDLKPFLDKKYIEIHGPEKINLAEKAKILSDSVGYNIEIQQVPREAFRDGLMSFGFLRVFADSFLETVEQVDGIDPPGYEPHHFADIVSSPELLAIWQPKYTAKDWAESDMVKAAFAK